VWGALSRLPVGPQMELGGEPPLHEPRNSVRTPSLACSRACPSPLVSACSQRARLLPAAAANASGSHALAQSRPLQMQFVLRCSRSHERCTTLIVHGRKRQGKLWVRAPSSWRRCLPLLRRMGGSMGWKLARLIRGIFWHTRTASRAGFEFFRLCIVPAWGVGQGLLGLALPQYKCGRQRFSKSIFG
jgi:hypothetical protein